MSQSYPPATPSESDAVARLAAHVRKLQLVTLIGVLASVIALVLAGVALSRSAGSPTAPGVTGTQAGVPASGAATPTVKPKPADAGPVQPGTIVLGATGQNLPVLDIYEDFQCPACAQVEKYFGAEVDAMVAANSIEVRYHMMSFLDQMLKNDSSVRAANGGFCAADQGKFLAWHDTLFAHHPANEGDGWTDAQLAGFAASAGLDVPAWTACVAAGKHADNVKQANDQAMKSGVNSTPTYKLNGQPLNLQSVAQAGGLKVIVDSVR